MALITCGLIISCGGSQFPPAETANTPDCRPVQHAIGETCIPLNLQRIIALSTPTMGNVLALGIKPVGSIFYFEMPPAYLKDKVEMIESVGTGEQPNLEKMLTLQPDLIIAPNEWNITYQQLSQIAPTVVGDWQGYPSWRDHFNFVANVLDKTQVAEQIWADYAQRIQSLKTALGTAYENKTVSFIYLCCGGISVDLKNSFSGMILEDLGLQRPSAQDLENGSGLIILSQERLIDVDADIIFLAVDEDDESQNMLHKLQQDPLWNQLEAVQNGKVYPVSLPTWRGGNPLAADAVIDDLFKYLVEDKTAS